VILKPQDVALLLKLVALKDQPWTYLAAALSISESQIHAAVHRAVAARLRVRAPRAGKPRVLSGQ